MIIQQNKIDEYVKRINPPVCPLCGHRNWTITNKIFQALEFDTDKLNLGGETFPIAPISCTNCGNTYFVNAIIAGFLDKPEEKKEEG